MRSSITGIAAISFVGSSDTRSILPRRSANNKRVQAFGGAKNHGIVLPDADLDQVVTDLTGAAFGSAGERCMALPVVVPVGEDTAERLKEKLLTSIAKLRIGVSNDPEADYGPVVTPEHKARIEQWITTAEEEGAEIVVDGRGFTLQGHEKGFFVGPTLIDRVTPQMKSYQEEIFGPVLQIVRAKDFEEAVRLPSEHQYGNGVAIFTRNGHAAREFAARVNCGHGRHQRADPRTGRLPLLRWVEAFGLRRHRPIRRGRPAVLDQEQEDHATLAGRRRGWLQRFRHSDDGVRMARLPILALILAVMLSACGSEQGEAPPTTATPIPGEPDGGTGNGAKTPDPAIAAGAIPARFHGVWDAVTGTCDPASDLRIEVTARRITFHESVGDVAGMGSEGDDAIADLVMEGEGETWVQPTRLSLEATPDGERLRLSDAVTPENPSQPLRKRCPA